MGVIFNFLWNKNWFILLFLLLSCFVQPSKMSLSHYLSYVNPIKVAVDLGWENCGYPSIAPDFEELEKELKSTIFGQENIIERILPLLKTHFNKEPRKSLVLCIHGSTGIGKNYLVEKIIENIYYKKANSRFVKYFFGRLNFPLNTDSAIGEYKKSLQKIIRETIAVCPRSIFVFDEVDKIPAGILDAIKPFLDYHQVIEGNSISEAIFIFISNLGGAKINQFYNENWMEGKKRSEISFKEVNKILTALLYSTKGAFQNSSVLESNLVSLYLPFFPLRLDHVKLCISAEAKKQNIEISEEDVKKILNEMEFDSKGNSVFGCKKVYELVSIYGTPAKGTTNQEL